MCLMARRGSRAALLSNFMQKEAPHPQYTLSQQQPMSDQTQRARRLDRCINPALGRGQPLELAWLDASGRRVLGQRTARSHRLHAAVDVVPPVLHAAGRALGSPHSRRSCDQSGDELSAQVSAVGQRLVLTCQTEPRTRPSAGSGAPAPSPHPWHHQHQEASAQPRRLPPSPPSSSPATPGRAPLHYSSPHQRALQLHGVSTCRLWYVRMSLSL